MGLDQQSSSEDLRGHRFGVNLPVLLVGFAALALLSACASNTSKKNERFAYVEQPVEQLYSRALDQMQRRRYEQAILLFDEVERQHPYSSWARRAMLMSAYAQYKTNAFEDAIASADRFISIHPGNKDAAYAYYLKAMCYYERIRDVGRDQDLTINARNALIDVVRRYPDSDYARDARLKLDLTNDHLAGKEMDIGRYYLRKNQQIAAINRFNNVVTNYQTTSQVEEALHRLVEAYLELGLVAEAQRSAAILGYNYPGGRWYQDSYKLFKNKGLEDQFPPKGATNPSPPTPVKPKKNVPPVVAPPDGK